MDVVGLEPTDFAVWEFVGYDAADKEVGRIPQALKVPYKNKKHLEFASVYFTGKPERFEIVLTDKKAVRASGKDGDKNGGGGGASVGGADIGGGAPPAGGGGAPPAGGGAPPSGGGGDGGGGGKGGDGGGDGGEE
jgi:hypothetical protein